MSMRQREEAQEVLRPRFQLVAVAILGFWLVMMTMLVRREILIPRMAGQSFQASAVPDAPQEAWMGIFLPSGQKIGFMHTTSTPELRDGDEGARLGLTVTMRTKILGEVTPVKVEGDAWASARHGLQDFDFSVRSGGYEAGINAIIRDGQIDATLEFGNERFPISWPVDKDLFLWSGMGASNTYFPAMEEGDEFFIDAFDPVTLMKSPVLIRCVGTEDFPLGDKIYSAKVIDMEFDTTTSRALIDSETGAVLRAETPMGITLQRIDPGEITQDLSDDEAADLFGLASVKGTGLVPSRNARRMKVRIAGLDAWTEVPVGDTQRAVVGEENTYEIVIPDAPTQTKDLTKTPSFSAAFPKRLGEKISEADSAWTQINAITGFVFREQPQPGRVSIDSLAAGSNARASRFVDLARAAGFEARVVAGLLWVDSDTRFQYHAWPEVQLDQWYWVDPMLAQWPADATHIQLSESPDDWPRLMRLFGTLDIEVLEVE